MCHLMTRTLIDSMIREYKVTPKTDWAVVQSRHYSMGLAAWSSFAAEEASPGCYQGILRLARAFTFKYALRYGLPFSEDRTSDVVEQIYRRMVSCTLREGVKEIYKYTIHYGVIRALFPHHRSKRRDGVSFVSLENTPQVYENLRVYPDFHDEPEWVCDLPENLQGLIIRLAYERPAFLYDHLKTIIYRPADFTRAIHAFLMSRGLRHRQAQREIMRARDIVLGSVA